MFAIALIVFREALEAALFVGIVAAATRGLPGRWRWLATGVGAGLAGAAALAAGAEEIGAWASGIGQDLVNVAILGLALAMLAWHCIWTSTHGREMALDARRLGVDVQSGARAPWALLAAVALAVLREGAETVLFVSGLSAGAGTAPAALLGGVLLGALGGVLLGTLMYQGLSRVQPQRLFAVANGLILLLAAAIASQLARSLEQAGLVELWTAPLWNSSWLLATDSAPGALLHALVGYDAQPSGLQLAFYLTALTLIGWGTWQVRRRQELPARASR